MFMNTIYIQYGELTIIFFFPFSDLGKNLIGQLHEDTFKGLESLSVL